MRLRSKKIVSAPAMTTVGQQKTSLADVLGVMNMIRHGIGAPSIRHTNTLAENVMDIQERDRHDIDLAKAVYFCPMGTYWVQNGQTIPENGQY